MAAEHVQGACLDAACLAHVHQFRTARRHPAANDLDQIRTTVAGQVVLEHSLRVRPASCSTVSPALQMDDQMRNISNPPETPWWIETPRVAVIARRPSPVAPWSSSIDP